MSAQEEPANVGKVLSFLREWDRGDRTGRGRTLSWFLGHSAGRTHDQLELQFAQVASLFLARLTAWMKVSSMFGSVSRLQLKAIGVFLCASSPDQYLGEFVDHGGVVTLLEVLNQPQCREEIKAEALRLLLAVSDAGRTYKEIICESHGATAAAECLTHSNTGEIQESARMLLDSLSHGNPKYEGQIYRGLIGHLTCTSAKAQQFVLHNLRNLQSIMEAAHHSIVEPLLSVLTSLHLEVQSEAVRLIFDLRRYDLRPVLLSGLLRQKICVPVKSSTARRDGGSISQKMMWMMADWTVLVLNWARALRNPTCQVTRTKMSERVKSKKKTKAAVKEEETSNPSSPSTYHFFHDAADVVLLRSRLLTWYDQEKRELPWRTLALTVSDVNIRTYAVWVSEIMLQQTQVATVIDYYNKWMKRWPTVQDLAAATLEEVNQMWAGLGYYSRGKRLHEGAQKVVSQLQGQMPRTVDALLKQLPGVGRYTAGAVGSIALGQVTGAVDGNVIRVLCRLRAIGADCTGPVVIEALWSLVNTLVDPDRPGDFNQAMMELGARICTPKGPLCSQCPVQSHCRSYQKVHFKQEKNSIRLMGKLDRKPPSLPDIEDCLNSGTCTLCPSEPWDDDLGVQNFPRKPAKKPPRAERSLTCVVIRKGDGGEHEFLLTQRPSKGLLAGLWEFPCVPHEDKNYNVEEKKVLCAEINRILGTSLTHSLLQYVGEVVHSFSHIHQTYVVHSLCLNDSGLRSENVQWLTRSALQDAAVSTGVKKIMKLCDSTLGQQGAPAGNQKRPRKERKEQTCKKPRLSGADSRSRQLSLSSFFQTVKQDC